ncbi:hypothetical protein A3740_09220 [Oleiphilus sp. HI0068]|nr:MULTISPECIES: Ig-like domain-containing protein [unclassified Oleiphilus]KZY77945.1 hypothetical protein A3740_09220 [Oleiphilus sp. HI0068]KZY88431.1 hypothetical protein A3741_00105 [Oleiphilus sp. HI0069]KZY88983.1 hypothetical protein A3743_09760 [Oleiphilus sp. HI0072]KZY28099.1 hypothetical protein A3729_14075 [Oleiphilus sp. HI0043]KZZ72251.1 hypothetical protein A3763_10265 [Oleiphilus sp. HI0128]
MHSHYLRAGKNKLILLVVIFLSGLSACDSDGTRSLPEAATDTTAPTIVRITPDSEEISYGVDLNPTVLFSEKMNIDSLLDNRVGIYSGSFDPDSITEPVEREINISHSTVPGESKVPDEESGKLIDVDATELTLGLSSGRFALHNTYTLQVESDVHDLVEDDLSTSEDERNFLEGGERVAFTTESGVWHESETLNFKYLNEEGTQAVFHQGDSFEPIIQSSQSGTTLLVWKQSVEGVTQIWASQYLADQEVWVLPGTESASRHCRKNPDSLDSSCVNSLRLDSAGLGSVYSPEIAINELGHAVVIWIQPRSPDAQLTAWVNMFDGNAWSGPRDLLSGSSVDGEVRNTSFSLSDSGGVVGGFIQQSSAGVQRVRLLSFNFITGFNGLGFGAPIYIDTVSGADVLGDAQDLELSLSSSGLGVVVWSQEVSGFDRVRARRFNVSSDATLSSDETQFVDVVGAETHFAVQPKPSISDNGDLYVAWRQSSGGRYDLMLNRNASGEWEDAKKIEYDDSASVSEFTLAHNNLNELFVAWSMLFDDGVNSLTVRSYHPGSGFSTAEDIPVTGSGSERPVTSPLLNFDYEGNGVLSWVQNTSFHPKIKTRQYSKLSKVWLSESTIVQETSGAEVLTLRQNALLRDGRILSVWGLSDVTGASLGSALFKEYLPPIE